MEYTVDAATGCYNLQARFATISTGKSLIAKLDGEVLGTFNLPNTGDWGNFQTIELNDIFLQEGNEQILRLEFVGGGTNLNWVRFSTGSAITPVSLGNSSVTDAALDGWNLSLIHI